MESLLGKKLDFIPVPPHPSPYPQGLASSWCMVGHNSRRNKLINMIHKDTTLVAGHLPFSRTGNRPHAPL